MSRKTGTRKPQKVYCICKTDGNDGKFMAACDGCDGWFHPLCIGTTKPKIDRLTRAGLKFLCPDCTKSNNDKLHKIINNEEIIPLLRNSLHDLNGSTFNNRSNPEKDPFIESFLSGTNYTVKKDGNSINVFSESQKNKLRTVIKYFVSLNNEMKKTLGNMLSKGKLTSKYLYGSNSFQYFEANIAPGLVDKKLQRKDNLSSEKTSSNNSPNESEKIVTGTKRAAENNDEIASLAPSKRKRKMTSDLEYENNNSANDTSSSLKTNKRAAKSGEIEERHKMESENDNGNDADADDDDDSDDVSEKSILISEKVNTNDDKKITNKKIINLPNKKKNTTEITKMNTTEIIWKGLIERSVKTKFGTFNISGKVVFGNEEIIKILPPNIEFIGRLKTMNLMEYLRQLLLSGSRLYSMLRIEPNPTQSEIGYFNVVHKYFIDRQRAGSLQVAKKSVPGGGNVPDEIYLLPIGKDEQLPDFIVEKVPVNNIGLIKEYSSKPFGRMFLIVVAKTSILRK